MNAPVPPAQFPFMRKSTGRSLWRKTTLASSPPISIIERMEGYSSVTNFVAATTSCTNGNPQRSATPIPTLPVMEIVQGVSPVRADTSSRKVYINGYTAAWCRSYRLYMTSPSWLRTTIFAVVDPISIPILCVFIIYTFYYV